MKDILCNQSTADIAVILKFPTKIQGLAFQLLLSGAPLEKLKKEAYKKSNEEEKACGSVSLDSESDSDFSLYEMLPAAMLPIEVDDWRCENMDVIFESLFAILAGTTKEIGFEMGVGERRAQQIINVALTKIKKLKETEKFGFSEEVKSILRNDFLRNVDFVFKKQGDFFGGQHE